VTDRYQDLRDSEAVGIVTAAIVRGTHDQRQKSAFDLVFSVAIGGSRCPRREAGEIVQRHGEITPGAALCIAVECAAVMSEPGLFDR
jgi:hypothetical protein